MQFNTSYKKTVEGTIDLHYSLYSDILICSESVKMLKLETHRAKKIVPMILLIGGVQSRLIISCLILCD